MELDSVETAVRKELESFGERTPPALAASAVRLAKEMDDPENSATSKSMCSKALLETMKTLRELAPPPARKDAVDELSDRRRACRSGGATA